MEYKKNKLGDLYEVASGLSKSAKEFGTGEFPFLSFKTVFYNYFLPDELPDNANTTEIEQLKCSIQAGDVFLTRTSETANELGMSSVALKDYPYATFNGFSKRLRLKSNAKLEVYPKYMGYYLRSFGFRSQINSMSIASTRASLNIEMINRLTVNLPDLNSQKKIGNFLFLIDQKISNNKAINRNLYAQASALVDAWETEESSHIEYKTLTDVAELNPDTYSPKEEWDLVNYLDTSSITEGAIAELTLIRPQEEKLPSRARRKLKAKDIVYSTVRPNQKHYGFIAQPAKNMLASTGFVVIRSKNLAISNEFLYLLLTRKSITEKMQQIAEQSTSTFPSIRPADLGACEIPVAKDGCNVSMLSSLKDLFQRMDNNQRENKRLAELRDSLLPKLMSGELDVSDLQL